jgi:hypothetical protein
MNRLLRRTVPHAPAETIRRIFDLSEGRPYVAEELARSFAERGPAFDQTAGLPLRSAILNRLEELSPSERGIVERASVLGRNFRPNDLFDIDSPPGEVRAALRAGVALQLFEEHEVAERPWFRFRHALTREIIYREIRSDERRALHLAMADHFEPLNDRAAEFAYHVSAAGDAYRAGPANERAADGVANIAASSDAATLYAKALEFTSEPDDLVRIARKYVAALRSVSDVEQLAREIPPLAKRLVAGDRVDDATDILITSADAVGSLDFARAQGLLDQIDAQLSERTPAHQRFVFELLRARFLVDQSRYDEAQEACRRAETALKTEPQPTSRDRLTLMRILALCSRDDVIAAKVHAEYERVLRTQDWDTADEATCLAIIGIAEFDALQVRLGFEHLAEAARIRERTRGGHFMWTYQTAAYMAAEAGDFAFTKAALERLEREGREVGDDLGQGLSRLIRACGGDVRPCLQGLDRARKLRSWSYAGGYAADLAFTYEETPERARKIAVDTFDAMPPGSVAKSDLIQAVVAFGSFEEASRAIDAIPFDSEIDHVRFRLTTLLARALRAPPATPSGRQAHCGGGARNSTPERRVGLYVGRVRTIRRRRTGARCPRYRRSDGRARTIRSPSYHRRSERDVARRTGAEADAPRGTDRARDRRRRLEPRSRRTPRDRAPHRRRTRREHLRKARGQFAPTTGETLRVTKRPARLPSGSRSFRSGSG